MSDFAKTLMSAMETYTNDVAVATKKAIRKTANQVTKKQQNCLNNSENFITMPLKNTTPTALATKKKKIRQL